MSTQSDELSHRAAGGSVAIPVAVASPTGGGGSGSGSDERSPIGGNMAAYQPDMSRTSEAAARQTLIRRVACGGAVVALLALFVRAAPKYTDVFLYHPTSMAIACVGLLPEVVALALQAKRSSSFHVRNEQVQAHVLVAVAFKLVALAGYAAIWKSKVDRGKPHFTTWHGKLGLLSFVLLVAQVLLGFAQFLALPSLVNTATRIWCKNAHRLLSSALGAAFGAAFALGFASNYAVKVLPDQDWLRVVSGLTAICAVVWALMRE